MRSRDGNRTLSCRFCTLVLLSSLALNASEYLISYRYVVKNAILYNETLQISKAMQKCIGIPQTSLLLQQKNSKDIQKIIYNHMNEFITYIQKIGINVEHKEKNTNYQNSSTTILTMHTRCFKVDFNDNFAKITALK